tara:strand:+ start:365 stop:523 length:159 start_codon:yes stop_codon:yes gene_type:complete
MTDSIVEHMIANDIQLTRENYIALAFGGVDDIDLDDLHPEHEAMIPDQFRKQ